ncbi:hypothetical protein FV194_33720, partial [Pseudomonas aeruginosa]|nr:hypothetical protein [Pseudomonas aeruginosa]
PVAARLGAHQPHRRLPLAQQRQDRRGQVQAATTAATGLACFIFRFLRRPLVASRQNQPVVELVHNIPLNNACHRFWAYGPIIAPSIVVVLASLILSQPVQTSAQTRMPGC